MDLKVPKNPFLPTPKAVRTPEELQAYLRSLIAKIEEMHRKLYVNFQNLGDNALPEIESDIDDLESDMTTAQTDITNLQGESIVNVLHNSTDDQVNIGDTTALEQIQCTGTVTGGGTILVYASMAFTNTTASQEWVHIYLEQSANGSSWSDVEATSRAWIGHCHPSGSEDQYGNIAAVAKVNSYSGGTLYFRIMARSSAPSSGDITSEAKTIQAVEYLK